MLNRLVGIVLQHTITNVFNERLSLTPKRTAKETRTLIFEACKRILEKKGSRGLTLDAVAEEAKLSKGGLLYHFATKETLVKELFENFIAVFDQQLERLCEQEGNVRGSWLRAYAKGSMEQALDPSISKFIVSLLASVDEFPWVHSFMQEKYVEWQAKVEALSIDPVVASLVRLTIDGLWFSELYQYAPPSNERREEILNLLFKLISEQSQQAT